MVHSEVYEEFTSIFADLVHRVQDWYPNGKNSIRIQCADKKEYIFSIESEENWKFETVSSFINNLKGGI